jgi:hypothetical protein
MIESLASVAKTQIAANACDRAMFYRFLNLPLAIEDSLSLLRLCVISTIINLITQYNRQAPRSAG